MLLKFFKHGQGAISSAINYLINIGDIENKKVIRGNSSLTQSIANTINFTNIYKSGVLLFEESDISTDTKEDIMDLFEETIFAGIDRDDRNILWVEHKDKDRLELHFLIPRVHLGIQKAFNPYYHKIDLKRVDTFKEYINLKYNLTDPNDPQKSRTHSYNNNPKLNLPEKISKDELVSELYRAVGRGTINNREELIASLKTAGYKIPRAGKEYISVKTDDMKRAVRFKGGIFNETFTSVTKLEKAYKDKITAYKQRSSEDISDRLQKLKGELDQLNRAKSLYYKKRYKLNNTKDSITTDNHQLSIGNGSDVLYRQEHFENIQNRRWNNRTIQQGLADEQETDSYNNIIKRIRISREERKSAYAKTRQSRKSVFEHNREARNSSYSEFKRARGAVHANLAKDIKQRCNSSIKQAYRSIGEIGKRVQSLIKEAQHSQSVYGSDFSIGGR